jgi:PAS domain S-box-containing protein
MTAHGGEAPAARDERVVQSAHRLLIVEDNPGDAALLDELFLEHVRAPVTLSHVMTLREGLAALARDEYDAVILDLNLPDSRGPETLQAVAAVRREAQIIVVAGGIETGMFEALRAAGATDVFRKEETGGPLFPRLVTEILRHGRAQDRNVQLEMLLEAMPDAVLVLGEDGLVRSVNRAAVALFSRTADELIGERLGFSVHDGDTTEITIPQPGGPRHCEMRVAPILWDGRDCVLAAIRDVTARHLSDQALRQSEQHFATAQHIAAVGSFVLDLPSNRLRGSPQFHAIFGVESDGVGDWADFWREAVSADDRARLAVQDAAVWAGEEPHPIEFGFVRGLDGAHRVARREVDIVRDEAGEPVALIGVASDVTELRLAEARARELNRELELRVALRTEQLQLANGELQAFAYSVSHDLRTPLRAIDWLAHSLIEQYAPSLEAECRDRLLAITASVAHMSELIEDLLAYSRIGRQRLRRSEIDVAALVADLARELRNAYPDKTFVLDCGALPTVRGDPTLIRMVFQNLLDNALKFSRSSQSCRIEIGCRNDGPDGAQTPVFHVRDNGVGFDPRFADKLFGVFQKLHKPQDFPGTGIGLAIVQRIVHRHGGTIWAQAAPNEGATFSFTLPDRRSGPAAGAER